MKLRKLIAFALCVLILLGLVGCSAPSKDTTTNGMLDNVPKDEIATDSELSANLPDDRKLIQTVHMSAETEDLDAVLSQLNSRIAELGGYVQNSNIQNGSAYSGKRYRSASLTVRIPAENLNSFVENIGDVSNVVSSQKTVEDVTLSYVATESRMKALQAEEARLLELMDQAKDLNDLLTIESRLTDVRTELEQVTSALKVLTNQVDYSTVYLNISEVTEYTDTSEPESIWQRIGDGFVESLENIGIFLEELFVFLIVALPYLVLISVVPVAILLIIRGKKKKKKQAANENQEP